jgi:RNA polymerase-interacting CarD/CdnL/TRCF family regulator
MKEYTTGDWVVHAYYGIGQIEGVEEMGISGDETLYYKIRTDDSIFWMPVEQIGSDLIRRIADEEEIEHVVTVLNREPKEMSSNHQTRKSRIRQTQLLNTPVAFARLIRDLHARQVTKGKLNLNEKSAFNKFKKRLAEEWAVANDSTTKKITKKLENLLNQQEPLVE